MRHRARYLGDEEFAQLQALLMSHPAAGDVVPETGGLRKLRVADARRHKGTRGGLRVIYYWWSTGPQFWLFTVYGKGEVADLTPAERRAFKALLKKELEVRQ